MHTELFETYNENVIAISVQIDLNDLKTVISISVTKNGSNVLQL